MKQVTIVGGGIGAMSSAVRLLNNGYKVRIIEKESTLGGKVNIIQNNNARFDLTASIMMTPNIYTDIFKECGRDYKDYFTMHKVKCLYNVYSSTKEKFKLYNDINETTKELEKLQVGLSNEYLEFINISHKNYLISNRYFLNKPMKNISEILNIETISNIKKIKILKNSYKYTRNIITNEFLIQLLLFQTMYIGINPYTNSSIYTLIPAITQEYGLYHIQGGMYSYINALEKLIIELGGDIILNKEVIKIDSKTKEVKTKNRTYKSDIIVNNTDYMYTQRELLENTNKNKEASCSVFIIYLGLNTSFENLNIHNVYINKKQRKSMNEVFSGKLSQNPDIYLYYPGNIDNTVVGNFKSIMNVVVRVPNLSYKNIKWDKQSIQNYRNTIIKELKNIEELENIEDHIEYENYLTPVDLKNKYNAYEGSAYGLSHKLSQSAIFRPNMVDKNTKGLYHIGSSVHPGNGVSVIIEGSKVLVNEIIKREK